MKIAPALLKPLSFIVVAALLVSSGFAATRKFDRHRKVSQGWNDSPQMSVGLLSTGSSVPGGGSPSLSLGSLEAPAVVLSPDDAVSWNGGTGNWDSSKWTPHSPGPGDDVTINSGTNDLVTLDMSSPTVNTLTLGGNKNGVTSELDVTAAQTLAIKTFLNVGQQGTLSLSGGSTVNTGTLANSGYIYVGTSATLNLTNQPDGITDIVAGSTFQIQGTFNNLTDPINPISAFTHLVGVDAGGKLTLENGQTTSILNSFTNGGSIFLNGGSKLYLFDWTNNGTFTTGSDFTGGNEVNGGSGNFDNYGSFTLQGPDDKLLGGSLTNHGGGSIMLNGVNVTIDDVFNESGGTLRLNAANAVATIAGLQNDGSFVLNAANAIATITGSVDNSGTFQLNGPGDKATIGSGLGTALTNNPGGFVDVEGGSTLTINGDVTNASGGSGQQGIFTSYNGTGGNTLNISGILTNSGTFKLNGPGDTANVATLDNSGFVYVGTGATLNLTNQPGGITDIVYGAMFDIAGTFHDVINNANAFANLANVEGTLILENGQTTSVAAGLVNVGSIGLDKATKVTVNGDLTNGFEVLGGEIELNNASQLTVTGNLENSNIVERKGEISLLNGSALTVGGSVSNAATVSVYSGSTLQVSGDFDSFMFSSGGGATVNITGNLTNEGETPGGGEAQFDLFGPGDKATVGGNVTNSGSLSVDHGSTLTVSGDLDVGTAGATGSLTVMNGSTVTNQNGFVGNGAGSSGTATVSGAGSSWVNLGSLSVGVNGGSGLLVVNNGGTVTAQTITIGTLGEIDAKGGTLNYSALNDYGKLDPVGTATLIGTMLTVFPQGSVVLDFLGKNPGQYGQLDITGSALWDLKGLLVLDFMNGFAPKTGDMFDLINISGSLTPPSKDDIEIMGLQDGFEYHTEFVNGEYTLIADNNGVPAAEPATLLVLIPGLLGAGYGLRRKLLQ